MFLVHITKLRVLGNLSLIPCIVKHISHCKGSFKGQSMKVRGILQGFIVVFKLQVQLITAFVCGPNLVSKEQKPILQQSLLKNVVFGYFTEIGR